LLTCGWLSGGNAAAEKGNTNKAKSPIFEIGSEVRPGGATGRDGSPLLSAILAPLAVALHETLAVSPS
jgi:hypothetical protein